MKIVTLYIKQQSFQSRVSVLKGHDTTAAAANWAVHLIGAHPEVQSRLHEEMDGIFGDSDRPATMDDLRDMKYLECVIKETLRIFPSVPIFGRQLQEDTEICNFSFLFFVLFRAAEWSRYTRVLTVQGKQGKQKRKELC